MSNFEKPLKDFTEEELQQKVNQVDPKYAALAQYELQRRLQEKNADQISTLTKELKKLKDVTKQNADISTKNADSDNRLARIAISIAIASLIVQTAFSIHHKLECRFNGIDGKEHYYSGCYRTFDFGIFGTIPFKVKDFTTPVNSDS